MSAATASGVTARHSSESNEHFSPGVIVEAARQTMGAIDLDPASCMKADATVRAGRYFSASLNGFGREWSGRVFLNPPGGRCDMSGRTVAADKDRGKGFFYADGSPCIGHAQSSAKAWWFKLAAEFKSGLVTEAIFVGFSLEILQSTQVDPTGLLPLDFSLCFPARRVAYIKPDGTVGKQPPHASVVIYMGPNTARFREAFSPIGKVLATTPAGG